MTTPEWWPDYDPWDGKKPLGVAAEAYAVVLGWRVIPLFGVHSDGTCECGRGRHGTDVGKHPRLKDWPAHATADRPTIRRWWRTSPMANIGIATGQGSGIVALDLDLDHGALETLEALEADHEPLPDGPLNLTGSGGFHRLYRAPDHPTPNSVGENGLGPGLDVRGDGGQIVAPPSMHYSGHRYLWEVSSHPMDTPLPPLPEWLDARLRAGVRGATGRRTDPDEDPAWLRSVLAGPIGEGARNDTLARVTGHLLLYSVEPRLAERLILSLNVARCRPPLPEDEVRGLVDSIAGRELARKQARHG